MTKTETDRPETTFAPDDIFPRKATMLFGIGAQKAGTTWLYDTLKRSADVHFCKNKELHYFDVASGRDPLALENRIAGIQRLAGRLKPEPGKGGGNRNVNFLPRMADLAELLQIYTGKDGDHTPYLDYLLRDYRDQKIVCDITPAYAILHEETFADMARIGNAKFLFIMRDPIKRMWSQIRMTMQVEGHDPALSFEEACVQRGDLLIETGRLPIVERANYKLTIERLEAAVPRERIKYVFFEELFLPQTVQDICGFLGIAAVPADGAKESNTGQKAAMPEYLQSAFRDAFDPQYSFLRSHLGNAVPDSWCP